MKVLALGLPRTGIRSISIALSLLGFTHCAHGFHLIDNPPYTKKVGIIALNHKYHPPKMANLVSQKPFWDSLLGHCQAVTDAPCARNFLARINIEMYPEAKSCACRERGTREKNGIRVFVRGVIEPMFSTLGVFMRKYVEALLGSRVGAETEEGMKGNAREVYRRHYSEVREAVEKERILEFRLEEGWGPLCQFLGVDVPKGAEFPRVNEGEALKVKIREVQEKMMREAGEMVVRRGLPALLVGLFAYFVWKLR